SDGSKEYMIRSPSKDSIFDKRGVTAQPWAGGSTSHHSLCSYYECWYFSLTSIPVTLLFI
ncbi:MAG: hypothetical protein KAI94_14325, partial [Anaerolineales bacterium]|nr:hypothetical protein [Anaerolineales bacterium]